MLISSLLNCLLDWTASLSEYERMGQHFRLASTHNISSFADMSQARRARELQQKRTIACMSEHNSQERRPGKTSWTLQPTPPYPQH